MAYWYQLRRVTICWHSLPTDVCKATLAYCLCFVSAVDQRYEPPLRPPAVCVVVGVYWSPGPETGILVSLLHNPRQLIHRPTAVLQPCIFPLRQLNKPICRGLLGETEKFNGATIMYFPFQSYRQAIALSPNMLNAHMNLGALLHIRVSAQLHICPVGVACRQVTGERIRMSSPFSNK